MREGEGEGEGEGRQVLVREGVREEIKGRDYLFLGCSLARKVCLLLSIYSPMAPSLPLWPPPSYLGTTTMTTSSSYGRTSTSGTASSTRCERGR